uniref:Superoxide dismutase copper/zinc binding domain-containing protein n=1 Tax=viral metagenome TaxID=1070528 RepID=A0A6C0LUP8_9ZZZZ
MKQAICQINHPKNHGYILFTEYSDYTLVSYDLFNLPPGKHGIHIHQSADLRNGCDSLGSHFTLPQKTHLDKNQLGNHIGDLGNLNVNDLGKTQYSIHITFLPLEGKWSIIGRSVVIHHDEDDMGLGNYNDSKTSGHSGSRIACGIIGHI